MPIKQIRKQAGLALVYGLFMLMAGVVALFFLFSVGQLTHDKTKLVNATDAAAYSAGVMHARGMNFAAYTNRALVADEVAIAQSVSLASWGKYLETHGETAMALGCNPQNYYISDPAVELMVRYAAICSVLGTAAQQGVLSTVRSILQKGAGAAAIAANVSETILKAAQSVVLKTLPLARQNVMQEVADANYQDDGGIRVDEIPLLDTFLLFSNGNAMVKTYSGDERARMRDFEVAVVNKDGFTPSRAWSDEARIPSCVLGSLYYNSVDRRGATQLVGYDEWRANDVANYYRWFYHRPKFGLPSCRQSGSSLSNEGQSASVKGAADIQDNNWQYGGVPSFSELSQAALNQPDPRAQFAVRLLRKNSDKKPSAIVAGSRTNPFVNPSDKTFVGLAASETFFQRPTPRSDGKKELASLFNPYWQTHLMEVPAQTRAVALARQGVVAP